MRSILVLVAILGIGVFLVGCSADGSDDAAADASPVTEANTAETPVEPPADAAPEEPAAPSRISVKMGAPTEFAMVPETPQVAAGKVTLDVSNDGAIEHEVVIIRTDLDSGALPVDGDGAALEDGAIVPHGDGHDEGEAHAGVHFAQGKGGEVSLDLEPGKYAVVCNLPGHYASGMHANLEVV